MTQTPPWTVDRFEGAIHGFNDVFVDEKSAFLAGSFIMLRRVGDGPWRHVPLRGKSQIVSLSGAGSLLVAVGHPHSAYVSNDGGAKWQSRALKARYFLKNVACASEQLVAVTGDCDTFVSGDAGKTFQKVEGCNQVLVSRGRLLAFSEFERPEGLFCWDEPQASWRKLGSTPKTPRLMVAVGDALIVAAKGGLHRSTDNGGTWEFVHPFDDVLLGAASRPDGHVAVVGIHGAILLSQDAGLRWQHSAPTRAHLKAATFAPDGTLWAVGEEGVLVRSGVHAAMQTATMAAVEEPAKGKPSGKAARKAPEQAAPAPAPEGAILRPPSTIPTWSPPEPAQPPVHAAPVTAAAFIDEERFVTGDAQGRVLLSRRDAEGRWSTDEGLFTAPEAKPIAALAAWGELVFAACGGHVLQLDLRSPGQATKLTAGPAISHLSARAGRLVAAGEGAAQSWTIQGASVTPLGKISLPGKPISDLDLSLDGSRLAVVLGNAEVEVHDPAGEKKLGAWRRADARLRFTPGGDKFYLSINRFELRLVSTAKGGGKEQITTHNEHRCVVSSPGVRHIAALSREDSLNVIETASHQHVLGWRAGDGKTLSGAPREQPSGQSRRARGESGDPGAVTALAVSDGGRLVAGDVSGEVAIFDGATLELQRAARPRSTRVQAALEAPLIDVPVLASGQGEPGIALFFGEDGRVRSVDVATGAVHAGPELEVGGSLLLMGEVLVIATSEGWRGVDYATGRHRWTTSFPVEQAVRHGGAIYGFERLPRASGQRVSHRLLRLDPATGVRREIPLTPPVQGADADGFMAGLTATAQGLLGGFVDASDKRYDMRIDTKKGQTRVISLQREGKEPDLNLIGRSARVSPSGRYLLWQDDEQCLVRDGHDAALALVGAPVLAGYRAVWHAQPLFEHGRIIGVDGASGRLCVFDLDGKLVASMGGVGSANHQGASVYGTPNARAVVMWNDGDVVRRWPLP